MFKSGTLYSDVWGENRSSIVFKKDKTFSVSNNISGFWNISEEKESEIVIVFRYKLSNIEVTHIVKFFIIKDIIYVPAPHDNHFICKEIWYPNTNIFGFKHDVPMCLNATKLEIVTEKIREKGRSFKSNYFLNFR